MVDDSFFSTRFEQRLHLILEQRHLRDAMRVLNDDNDEGRHGGGGSAADDTTTMLGEFRRRLNTAVLALKGAGSDEHRIFQDLRQLVIRAGMEAVEHQLEQAYSNAGVQKQTFRAAGGGGGGGGGSDGGGGGTECSICFEEFVDGEQVCVMPCLCRGHRFHPGCMFKWLEISSMCPLCRHQLPAPCAYD